MSTPLVIFFHGEIIEKNVEDFEQIIRADKQQVFLFINSIGGCVDTAFRLFKGFRTLSEQFGSEIITCNVRKVESAANYLFLAGDKRHCLPNTRFMQHEMRSKMTESKADELHKILSALNVSFNTVPQGEGDITERGYDELISMARTLPGFSALTSLLEGWKTEILSLRFRAQSIYKDVVPEVANISEILLGAKKSWTHTSALNDGIVHFCYSPALPNDFVLHFIYGGPQAPD